MSKENTVKVEAEEIQIQPRVYKEERFEFTLFVNDNIICRRNFKINDYIEHSMESMEFKGLVDKITELVDNDLKSKTRVYTWYYFNPNEEKPLEEFSEPLLDPWECTFKFVVSDRKRPIITKVWDGYAYAKSVRDKVDIGNKTVKIVNKDGKQYVFDKEKFFNDESQHLSFELEVLRSQIMDKSDLLLQITKMICETCSPSGGEYNSINDYTLQETFGDVRYNNNIKSINRKIEREWDEALKAKTSQYFKNLY